VWVKSFGGYASEEDVVDQVFTFFDDLDEAGIKVRQVRVRGDEAQSLRP